mgnify:CR=1 FL=1
MPYASSVRYIFFSLGCEALEAEKFLALGVGRVSSSFFFSLRDGLRYSDSVEDSVAEVLTSTLSVK